MLVRMRFQTGPRFSHRAGKNRKIALVSASLFTLAAVSAFSLGAWRMGADLGYAGTFIISDGLLSHWQVWLAIAVALEYCSWRLGRYGRLEIVGPAEADIKPGKAAEEATDTEAAAGF